MKDEIKEILEDVKRHLDYVEATKQSSIRDNEMKVMYDYITNLQEENERLSVELNKNMIERNNYLSRNEKAIEIYEKRTTCEYKKKRFMEDKNTSDLMYDVLKGSDKE